MTDPVSAEVSWGCTMAAVEELTPEQRDRLRSALRLVVDYILEQAALNGHNEAPREADSERVVECQEVQQKSHRPSTTGALATRHEKED